MINIISKVHYDFTIMLLNCFFNALLMQWYLKEQLYLLDVLFGQCDQAKPMMVPPVCNIVTG